MIKNFLLMGKGDKKTAKGKRNMGSFGNTRRKKTSKAHGVAKQSDATAQNKN